MKKQLLNFLLLILLVGCQVFVSDRKIVDKYWLITIDTKADLSLSYQLENGDFIGIINGGVFAIGNNAEYIIVKQHPYKFGPEPINKSITNYYIVPIDRNISQYKVEKNLIGPLNEIEFEKQKEKLMIPNDLTFNVVIKGNK